MSIDGFSAGNKDLVYLSLVNTEILGEIPHSSGKDNAHNRPGRFADAVSYRRAPNQLRTICGHLESPIEGINGRMV
jgi:hypothetical protein